MNDTELDQMLARALDVAPTPEFTARVRTRIAEEPRRRAWLGPALWVVGATGALAAAAVALMAVLAGRPSRAPEPAALVARQLELPVTAPVAVRPDRTLAAAATAAPAVPGVARRGTAQTRAPEVLVSPAEAAGLRLLATAANEGRVVAAMFDASAPALPGVDDELRPPDDIVVAPLAPLNPITF